jgi:excinuclease ABC subunit B
MGRAARHINAHVIMYADIITESMQDAIKEINRRRQVQETYNKEHGITPQGIKKAIKDITERVQVVAETRTPYTVTPISKLEISQLIKQLESQMKVAAKNLEFEKAAMIRDRIIELRKDEELISPTAKR